MPFRLTNTLVDFQNFINDALYPFLEHFCTAYLDNILIYSMMLEEHCKHIQRILKALCTAGLHLKVQRCHFHKTEVKYLRLIILADSV